MPALYGGLPFAEAIAFFRKKVDVPTEAWDDLWQAQHQRAFSVAGAARDDLLEDFRTAVDRAVTEGITIEQFRKDFDEIVKRYGWEFKGNRDWRTRVIYDTNIRTSYQAARYQQMKAITERRPFWMYRHSPATRVPRPLHKDKWHGMVLLHDDPWWDTHYPPNGWGCRCFVQALGERDMARLGKDGPDKAPNDGTYEWVNPKSGEIHQVPRGIDPGWDYNVGKEAA